MDHHGMTTTTTRHKANAASRPAHACAEGHALLQWNIIGRWLPPYMDSKPATIHEPPVRHGLMVARRTAGTAAVHRGDDLAG